MDWSKLYCTHLSPRTLWEREKTLLVVASEAIAGALESHQRLQTSAYFWNAVIGFPWWLFDDKNICRTS
jgi:hypothetical protein